jgi:ABC-2 type transport system ATP-binding protein
VISIRNITRRFGNVTAVDNLTLEVASGEVFGLVGPDGAGKTTTLRMVCGLMDPSSGTATVAGFDAQSASQALKDHIGYMAQRFGLYSDLTVLENMKFYADLFGLPRAERAELLPKLLKMTRMEAFVHRAAGHLSGGMKQKLALMCTLLHKPQVLFLDEPTNGVDPVSRRDFWTILREFVKTGITVFVTTAYLDEAERCDRVGLMDRGRLIQCDTPEALKKNLPETTWEVVGTDLRATRDALRARPGVLAVELAGASLHLFTDAHFTPEGLRARVIVPSLEDVFIAHIRRQEQAA